MKKGIATQTILLILIGVIVIGIMVYLIYKAAKTEGLSMYECKAKLMEICRICENTDWSEDYDLPSDIITECSKYPEFFYWSDNTKCCGDILLCGGTDGDCDTLMGLS